MLGKNRGPTEEALRSLQESESQKIVSGGRKAEGISVFVFARGRREISTALTGHEGISKTALGHRLIVDCRFVMMADWFVVRERLRGSLKDISHREHGDFYEGDYWGA